MPITANTIIRKLKSELARMNQEYRALEDDGEDESADEYWMEQSLDFVTLAEDLIKRVK